MPQQTQVRATPVVAIVDDDESLRSALESLLRASGYRPLLFADAAQFFGSETAPTCACLISDLQMPGINGLQMHTRLRAMGLRIPTIFISAFIEALPTSAIGHDGVVACLPKPFDSEHLLQCVAMALGQ